jgi:peroxiredoxin
VLDLRRELRAEQLLAAGDAKAALAEFRQVLAMPKMLLADALLAAGEEQEAIDLLTKDVTDHPHRVPSLARLLHASVVQDAAVHADRIDELERELTQRLVGLPRTPLLLRIGFGDRPPAAAADAAIAGDTAGFGEDFGARPPLASLGPAHWQPYAAAPLDLPAVAGGRWSLANARGKPVLVVFYLGFGCLHCVQQLEALAPLAGAFAAAGIEVVAVGNAPLAKAQDDVAALGDKVLPFPLLADPDLAAFRAFGCYDDFEQMPLHGTFLLDGASGVRWQDVGAEPFTAIAWLLEESKRLLALPAVGGSGSK